MGILDRLRGGQTGSDEVKQPWEMPKPLSDARIITENVGYSPSKVRGSIAELVFVHENRAIIVRGNILMLLDTSNCATSQESLRSEFNPDAERQVAELIDDKTYVPEHWLRECNGNRAQAYLRYSLQNAKIEMDDIEIPK